jgi:tRNA (cmo5U34)-methyltransferase
MADNTTAHAAADYEREVVGVIPFHAQILEQVVDVALGVVPAPRRWLDTGCGPGRLVEIARARAPEARFVLADPSDAMLALARARHADLPADRFVAAPSHALPEAEPFDVVTAVLCHHYHPDDEGHLAALRRCRALLSAGGVLVTVENVRAETDAGHALQRRRWASWQRGRGRSEDAIAAHLAREGTRIFPRRPSALRADLEAAGFAVVEMFWRAYGQAGFMAIAPAALRQRP